MPLFKGKIIAGDNLIVPVVMFHSVGLENTDWIFSHLSDPAASFKSKIELLSRKGYRFLFWKELYEHMAGKNQVKQPAVMLTFDDGYLDNWTYAFPILKQFGVKATIFVNPEFVDPSATPRPISENPARESHLNAQFQSKGFLNWAEMREMERSGLIDIQSHAMTHTWHYASPKLMDFHRPDNRAYPWLAWNACPARKPFYMSEDLNSCVAPGTPVYEAKKALICRRYFPPDELVRGMQDYVADAGGRDFFHHGDWRSRLQAVHAQLMARYGKNGRYETDEEYKARVNWELAESKCQIENALDKSVDFICWPGGGYNETVLSLAREIGYKSWTLSSKDGREIRNKPGAEPCQVKRVGSHTHYLRAKGRSYGYAGRYYFYLGLKEHQGSILSRWLKRVLLLSAMMRTKIHRFF